MPVPVLLVITIFAAITSAREPDTIVVRATVLRIDAEREAPGRFLGTVEVEHGRGRIELLVSHKTKIEKIVGNTCRPVAFGELRAGDRMEVVHSSIVLASDPPVAAAHRLVVLRPRK
jgi:hypothetical protein